MEEIGEVSASDTERAVRILQLVANQSFIEELMGYLHIPNCYTCYVPIGREDLYGVCGSFRLFKSYRSCVLSRRVDWLLSLSSSTLYRLYRLCVEWSC
jgi:hypothetical protein